MLGILLIGPLLSIVKSLHDQSENRERLAHSHVIGQDSAALFLWSGVSPSFRDLVSILYSAVVDNLFPKSVFVVDVARFSFEHETQRFFLMPSLVLVTYPSAKELMELT